MFFYYFFIKSITNGIFFSNINLEEKIVDYVNEFVFETLNNQRFLISNDNFQDKNDNEVNDFLLKKYLPSNDFIKQISKINFVAARFFRFEQLKILDISNDNKLFNEKVMENLKIVKQLRFEYALKRGGFYFIILLSQDKKNEYYSTSLTQELLKKNLDLTIINKTLQKKLQKKQ